jgi:putative sugar O-methyltransferase
MPTTTVADDPALLEQMMADMRRADPLYQPTNYWAFYESKFLPELRAKGLRDFRRRRNSVLSSFGATDLVTRPRLGVTGSIPGARYVSRALTAAAEHFPGVRLVEGYRNDAVVEYFYWHTRAKFERAGLDISVCATTDTGSPEDVVEIHGGRWSLGHLQMGAILADAAPHLTFDPSAVYMELGTGLGRNIEILARLMPDATLLMFDIPPQLYVSHQYMTAVFGDRVIGYREGMAIDPARDAAAIRGRIVIQPTWRIPDWTAVRIQGFWNSASFSEMESPVVANYLTQVRRMSPAWIYINALPEGNYWGEWKPGRGGTKEPVPDSIYSETLAPAYALAASYPTDYFLRRRQYMSYVFRPVL